MAECSISVSQDQFICPVCLELLKDPVTVSCGHSFCKVCINDCWDQEDQSGVYSCPQCRETFTPRPVLYRNNILNKMVEKLKKTELQADSAGHCYSGTTDVECDVCTETKLKAVKSCLVCLASFCETHIKPHYQSPAFKKHKLVEASSELQIYCRTDQSCVCSLNDLHEHKGHDIVSAASERVNKESEIKDVQMKCEQILQEKQKKAEELKQAVITIKRSAQAAVEDSERIFTELISSMEKKRSEVTELIRDQEMAELSRAEGLLEQLEQEIADLKRRDTELQQLSHTEDHIHFLQSFQSLCVFSGFEDFTSIDVNHNPSFDRFRKSLSGLKERLEEFCREELNKVTPLAAAAQIILPSEPKSREDFLIYMCELTLDPNTAHKHLSLSEGNNKVTYNWDQDPYPDHPGRFDNWGQVLSVESLTGRCYWEVECSGHPAGFAVAYKGIKRKGGSDESLFGRNINSWILYYNNNSFSVWHNNNETKISAPSHSSRNSCRVGVYVDWTGGTLSFYSISSDTHHTLTHLHTFHSTFTEPLHVGFDLWADTSVWFCGR